VSLSFDVTLRNESPNEVYWSSADNPYGDFSYKLTLDGHSVPKSRLLRDLTLDPRPGEPLVLPTRLISLPVESSGIRRYTIKLQELYELTEPGTYQFTVTRYDSVTKQDVSETAQIKVTAAAEQAK